MQKVMRALKFVFRNGETWTVEREHIDDLWIKQVTTSFGKIGDVFQEIHPCQSLKIVVDKEADEVHSSDINLGGLEQGMFERATKFQDIELMDILYREKVDGEKRTQVPKDRIYFPYKALDTDGCDNAYQSSKLAKGEKLYIVIDPERTVEDVYPELTSTVNA